MPSAILWQRGRDVLQKISSFKRAFQVSTGLVSRSNVAVEHDLSTVTKVSL
jgi:hypothetical protein